MIVGGGGGGEDTDLSEVMADTQAMTTDYAHSNIINEINAYQKCNII